VSWPVPERRKLLLTLWRGGWELHEIAEVYGGTKDGVRSTIRKMRERGEAPSRKRVGNRWVVA
jgi:DNA-directed RNA polymerase specialized sigma24 family protein